ncbi:MAG: hypothetical protein AAF682_13090 [Planctomycetota bacterium]
MLRLAVRSFSILALVGGALCPPADAQCDGDILVHEPGIDDSFGTDVDLVDGLMVVGDPGEGRIHFAQPGSGGDYVVTGGLSGSVGTGFGARVGLEGGSVYVGEAEYPMGGAVRRYQNFGGFWAPFAPLYAMDVTNVGDPVDPDGRFGADFDVDNGRLIVGAPDNLGGAGSAYIYDSWSSQPYSCRDMIIEAYPGVLGGIEPKHLGTSVAIEGNWAMVGAPGEGGIPGSIWSFKRNGGTWKCDGQLGATPFVPPWVRLGTRVELDDERLLYSQFAGGSYETRMYSLQAGAWSFEPFDAPGVVTAFAGDRAVTAGAVSFDAFSACATFSAWTHYRASDGSWVQGPEIEGPTLWNSFLGARAAIDGSEMAIAYPAVLCFGSPGDPFEGYVQIEDLDCYGGPAGDCDGNFVPDFVEIEAGLATDCNGDGVPDACATPVTLSLVSSDADGAVCQGEDFGLTADVTVAGGAATAPEIIWKADGTVLPPPSGVLSDGTEYQIASIPPTGDATSLLILTGFQSTATSVQTTVFEACVTVGACATVTDSVSVIAQPYPAKPAILSTAPVCEGDLIELTAVGTYASHAWFKSTGGGVFVPVSGGTDATLSVSTPLGATIESYMVVVSNAAGCTIGSDPVVLQASDIITKPTITAPSSPTCQGSSLTLCATPGYDEYHWSLDGELYQITTTEKLDLPTSNPDDIDGIYTVQVGFAGQFCTTPSEEVEITIDDVFTLDVVSSEPSGNVCQGGSFVLTATASPSTGAPISWSLDSAGLFHGAVGADGSEFSITNDLSSGVSTLTVDNFQGDAAVVATNLFEANVTDGGCDLNQTMSVDALSAPAKPTILSDGPVCEGHPLTLTVQGSYASHDWYDSSGLLVSGDPVGELAVPTGLGTPSSYYVVVSNAAGCTVDSDPFVIDASHVITKPEVTLSGGPACDGALVFTTEQGLGHYEWFFTNSDGTTSLSELSFASGASTYELVVETGDLDLIEGDYTVQVGSSSGPCTPASDPVSIDASALATKVDWIGIDGASGDFSDASKWTPCGPPQADVCVNQGASGFNTLRVDGSFSVANMRVWQDSPTFLQMVELDPGAALDVRSELWLGAGARVELQGGTVTAGAEQLGRLVLDGAQAAGTGLLPPTPELVGHGLIDTELDNGLRVQADSGTLVIDGPLLTNREDALLSTSSGEGAVLSVQTDAFVQEGTLDVAPDSQVRFGSGTALINDGRIVVQADGKLIGPALFVNNGSSTDSQVLGENGLYVDGTVEVLAGATLSNLGELFSSGGVIAGFLTNEGTFRVGGTEDSVVKGNLANPGLVVVMEDLVLTVEGDYLGSGDNVIGLGDCFEGTPGVTCDGGSVQDSADGGSAAGLTVYGDVVLEAGALLDLDGVFEVHGDWSVAIDDPASLDLAELRLGALFDTQAVEAIGVDYGTPGDWNAPALNAIGVVEVGPDLAQVTIHDDFDNSGEGTPNVFYAESLVVRSGSLLATAGNTVRAGHLELELGSTLDLGSGTVFYETVSPANPGAPGSGVTVVGSGELLPAPAPDCDRDGVSDADEIAAGAPDCDGNGIPDDCDYALGLAFDLDGNQTPDSCQQLSTDKPAVSLAAGTRQELRLHAGSPFAGGMYFLGGSATGTTPGFAFGGTVIPLNFDPYTWQTLAMPDMLPLLDNLGFLDENGDASASFGFEAGYEPLLAGLTLYHAFVVLDPSTFGIELVSNYVTVELQP